MPQQVRTGIELALLNQAGDARGHDDLAGVEPGKSVLGNGGHGDGSLSKRGTSPHRGEKPRWVERKRAAAAAAGRSGPRPFLGQLLDRGSMAVPGDHEPNGSASGRDRG